MSKPKQTQIWTVRNTQGQFLARYRAYTAEEAIQRLINDQHITASTFRKSQPVWLTRDMLTASVEP